MPTINDKELIDLLIKNDGHYEDDEQATRIVEYTNAWNVITYGVTYPRQDINKYMLPTYYVRKPKIIWERNITK